MRTITNFQAASSREVPSTKLQTFGARHVGHSAGLKRFEVWSLVFLWSLVLGAWNFFL
jgi:hypothetical protein